MKFDVILALHSLMNEKEYPNIERERVALQETKDTSSKLWALIESGELLKLADPLEPVAEDEAGYERQGFINGFRMGMRLSREVSNLDTGHFLHRIFSHAHVECSSPPLEEDRLSNLYKHMALAEKAFGAFTEALDKLDIPEDMRDRLKGLRCDELSAFEEQGFINGIQLGMKLAREAGT